MERGKDPRSINCPVFSRNNQLVSGFVSLPSRPLYCGPALLSAMQPAKNFLFSPLDVLGVLLGLSAPQVSHELFKIICFPRDDI